MLRAPRFAGSAAPVPTVAAHRLLQGAQGIGSTGGRVDATNRQRLAVRTVLVSFQAAMRHAQNGDRERLRTRALELLDVVAIRIEPERDPALARLLDEARETVASS